MVISRMQHCPVQGSKTGSGLQLIIVSLTGACRACFHLGQLHQKAQACYDAACLQDADTGGSMTDKLFKQCRREVAIGKWCFGVQQGGSTPGSGLMEWPEEMPWLAHGTSCSGAQGGAQVGIKKSRLEMSGHTIHDSQRIQKNTRSERKPQKTPIFSLEECFQNGI